MLLPILLFAAAVTPCGLAIPTAVPSTEPGALRTTQERKQSLVGQAVWPANRFFD
jgi:hypothetical protein